MSAVIAIFNIILVFSGAVLCWMGVIQYAKRTDQQRYVAFGFLPSILLKHDLLPKERKYIKIGFCSIYVSIVFFIGRILME